MSADPFEGWLEQLAVTADLAEHLREARAMVESRMGGENLEAAEGWQVGFRAIPKDAGNVDYYFVPVCVEGGMVVDVRPDLSHILSTRAGV